MKLKLFKWAQQLTVGISFFTLLLSAGHSSAAIFTVNDTSDNINGGMACTGGMNLCSLRDAIGLANGTVGADTITFDPALFNTGTPQVLTLNSNLPNIIDDLIILGPQTSLTISGNNSRRIFNLTNGSLTIGSPTHPGLNIASGFNNNSGGCISVETATTLEIFNSSLHLCRTGNNGGAIRNRGTVKMHNSTLSHNQAADRGGAIHNTSNGTLELNNVTIAFNTADSNLGGDGSGGGIFTNSGTVTLSNTLLAQNTDTGSQAPNCRGTVTSTGFNLIDNTGGCDILSQPGDIFNLDAGLSNLQLKGGPTQVIPLLLNSPALNAGGPNCETNDQRLIPRPQGSGCEIGAYESNDYADLQITKTVDHPEAGLGDTVVFTIEVVNLGPGQPTQVKISDFTTGPIQIQQIVPSAGVCTPIGTTPIVCDVGSLNVSQKKTVVITAKITGPGSINNTASVSSNFPDLNPSNNTINVGRDSRFIDLAVTQRTDRDKIGIEDDLAFNVTVINNGPNAATGVTLTDFISGPFTFISITSSQGTCNVATPIVCDLGTIPSGGVVTLVVKGKGNGEGKITHQVIVSSSIANQELNVTNNESTEVVNVVLLVRGGGEGSCTLTKTKTQLSYGLILLAIPLIVFEWMRRKKRA